MRSERHLSWALLGVVVCALSGGCRNQAGPALVDPGGSADGRLPCVRPLAEYCGSRPCPTYENSMADLRRAAGSSECFYASYGACGALRYTALAGPFGGETEYFAPDGTLIAAERSSDTNEFCDGTSFNAHFGPGLDCPLVPDEVLCDRFGNNSPGDSARPAGQSGAPD